MEFHKALHAEFNVEYSKGISQGNPRLFLQGVWQESPNDFLMNIQWKNFPGHSIRNPFKKFTTYLGIDSAALLHSCCVKNNNHNKKVTIPKKEEKNPRHFRSVGFPVFCENVVTTLKCLAWGRQAGAGVLVGGRENMSHPNRMVTTTEEYHGNLWQSAAWKRDENDKTFA